MFEYYDVAGTTGVILIVVSYFLLQTGRMRSNSLTFSVNNAVGAALILFSLYFEFNLSAFLIEFFWLFISIVGIVRYFGRVKSASA
ncbi:MAG: hypothetical protein WD795_19050 [Woeseia sp.]